MSTQITTQRILSFDEYADFASLPGIEGYIYIDKAAAEAYLWDSIAEEFVRIGLDNPLPQDPLPLTFVDAATVGALSFLPNYSNGTGGVGATLTATQVGMLRDTSGTGKIDSSYVPVVGGIILVKNQVDQKQNGIYSITTVGSPNPGGTLYQLTRVADFDSSAELFPLQVNVLQGTANANLYFNQATTPVTVGTSNIVFNPASYVSPSGVIAFVDVATTTALPTCVYANGTLNPSFPGLNATLTADAAGSVLTVDGLTASTSNVPLETFTRVLVKNQANKAHNGDYIVVNPGSATAKWQLRRINYGASGFYRFSRFFMVSNTQASLAGKIYITKQQNPTLSNLGIGTQNIDLVEYGGSSAYNLIQEEGTSLPARTTIDFQGTGVTATDDGTKTIVTIPGSVVVGENYVVVYTGDDWTKNATELQDAYTLAQTLTPNGNSISATNRVTLVCYPGYYDFRGDTFGVGVEYIDIVSITGNCDVNLISDGTLPPIEVAGAGRNFFYKGINTLNTPFYISTDTISTAIFENCKGGDYSFGYYDPILPPFDNRHDMGGTFIDCVGGENSFGSGYIASGIFTNCIAGDNSFGGSSTLVGPLSTPASATGTFTNCTARNYSFGVGDFCTGRFINCTANTKSFGYTCTEVTGAYFENCKGEDDCFVSSEIPNITIITITGDVINCTANDRSFGYGYETANCNLNFDSCIGNDYCFVVNMSGSNELIKAQVNCTARDYSFGYGSTTVGVKHNFDRCIGRDYCFSGLNLTGRHTNCIARNYSFENAADGTSAGKYYNCIAGNNSFGSVDSTGLYNNCSAGGESFGGSIGTCNGTYHYCRAGGDSFASDITGTLSGKLYWCEMTGTTFGTVVPLVGRTFYCVGNDLPNNQ
jgi:hypothetical protein